ncbi:MAG: hypothetical protein GWO07_00050 [Candidatus Dadabacteria bacterium]|nr:hypothetical protein [Candidatus Dadabacteria bacterium]NIS07177.1 hypothetical protein [Candidatus Dadabacteria bacterium]NIV41221.1 hypothetical protein [Candidatus Dadabacteria bacterium]NIX14306.1 hypothetical protein [Candidatus Dadabacteria bacterium]NIY20955.1 hypothetical protein [Candidatus Dadabacteria bacterium]
MRKLSNKSLERGKVTLTVPESRKDIIQRANKVAKTKGVTLSNFILDAVEDSVEKEELLIPNLDLGVEYEDLSDEELLVLSRESLSAIKEPLSASVSEQREER